MRLVRTRSRCFNPSCEPATTDAAPNVRSDVDRRQHDVVNARGTQAAGSFVDALLRHLRPLPRFGTDPMVLKRVEPDLYVATQVTNKSGKLIKFSLGISLARYQQVAYFVRFGQTAGSGCWSCRSSKYAVVYQRL